MYRTPLIPREAVSQASRGAYLLIATALELEDAGKVNSLILELFRVENITETIFVIAKKARHEQAQQKIVTKYFESLLDC